ncbi:CinA family protein [Flavobacterium phragmitis]|uniref:Competence/damage-inducible protein cinA n=1 Tax=Flavobacterium phragmitis TaxID=739143 RepID=A0A1I1WZ65_9FLAO|nr:CinA family protein [Flavobacterium phragmitis]SFD98743.1 competence/damage-inducible protein cinA [Flavobacterium phragmitis]
MPTEIISKCARILKSQNYNIAFAESVTAGRMAAEFSMTKNSGKVFRGGIVCYDIFVKEQILNVPHNIIEKYTPESAEVTRYLAEKTAAMFCADFTVAITGLASPGGSESKEKPVGTIFICIVTPFNLIEHAEVFSGTPEQIVLKAIDKSAELVLAIIN